MRPAEQAPIIEYNPIVSRMSRENYIIAPAVYCTNKLIVRDHFLPYLSPSYGTKNDAMTHPTKYEVPNKPITSSFSQVKSNLVGLTQL